MIIIMSRWPMNTHHLMACHAMPMVMAMATGIDSDIVERFQISLKDHC